MSIAVYFYRISEDVVNKYHASAFQTYIIQINRQMMKVSFIPKQLQKKYAY